MENYLQFCRSSEGMTSTNILDKLKGRLPTIQNEFVMVQNTNKNSTVKTKNINYEFKIKRKRRSSI